MPTIRPFLSATKHDLDDDYRADAINAITLADAVPITMESWDTSFEDPVEVCREQIRGSSHYIGIFAYRRGWIPPLLEKSITEAEFDWAEEFGKPMAVFLPNPKSPFTLKLKEWASKQSESDDQSQQAFLAKVQKKTYQLFASPSDLSSRVTRRVLRWSEGLRTQPPPQQNHENESETGPRRPDEVEINRLGRTEHERNFEDTVNIILRPGWSKTVCFLIHGRNGYGHSRLAARLRKKVETKPGIKQYPVTASTMWRKATSETLIEVIGSSIEKNWAPASIDLLAERFNKMLSQGDVVLEISSVQRLTESLNHFAEKFWQPLVAALDKDLSHRLIVLATLEEKMLPTWKQYVQPPLKRKATSFDPNRLIKLPELKAFEQEEVFTWLQNGGWVNPEDAQAFAHALISETSGHPDMLCFKLADKSTWIV